MGEFPFPCTICDKGFFDENTLSDHIFAHKGIKPYQCICGAKYQRKKNLLGHEKNCLDHQEHILRRDYGQTTNGQGALQQPSKRHESVDREEGATVDTWMKAGGVVQAEEGCE